MRYDTPVYFQTVTPGAYDPETGDYGADTVREVVRYAAVMDTRAETVTLVYGTVRQGSLTVQLQAQYAAPFDRLRIGETRYRVDSRRCFRTKEVLIVSEVQE